MLPGERKLRVQELLKTNQFLSVEELCGLLGVSRMTVRRDLAELEKEGLVVRSYGGVTRPHGVSSEPPFAVRAREQTDQKRLIARAASSLISDGECIGLDVGTSVFELAKLVRERQHLTVVTFSLPVANELVDQDGISVIVTGGMLRMRDRSLVGHLAERALEEVILDKVFLGVAGLDVELGLTAFNMEDALVKRVLIQRAREVVVLADSTKFGRSAFAFVEQLRCVTRVVTDAGAPPDQVAQLRSGGIEVIVADVDGG